MSRIVLWNESRWIRPFDLYWDDAVCNLVWQSHIGCDVGCSDWSSKSGGGVGPGGGGGRRRLCRIGHGGRVWKIDGWS